tara:strand:- start:83 stop:1198 length:1116 start_codon:yes stop_codon:yes gene_type:complete
MSRRITLNHLLFDAHLHLRDGQMLGTVAPLAAKKFWAGVIMPNLVPPVVTAQDAVNYQTRIRKALGDESFEPYMTLYLTDNTDPDDVARAYESGIAVAVKKYPLHGTTNSTSAVTDLAKVTDVLQVMSEIGMPLCIHGEEVVLDGEPINHLKREPFYVAGELNEILDSFPNLRVSLEHISTKEAAELIDKYGNENFVATVTPQHLVTHLGRAMYTSDGAYMPCAKDIEDMLALRELIASGCEWIHLGTDCAPHSEEKKEAVQCACGAFTALNAVELYLEALSEANALHLFEEFACLRGPRFFGIEPQPGTVVYKQQDWQVEDFVTSYGLNHAGEDFNIRPFGFRTATEEAAHMGVNRTMTWRQSAPTFQAG